MATKYTFTCDRCGAETSGPQTSPEVHVPIVVASHTRVDHQTIEKGSKRETQVCSPDCGAKAAHAQLDQMLADARRHFVDGPPGLPYRYELELVVLPPRDPSKVGKGGQR